MVQSTGRNHRCASVSSGGGHGGSRPRGPASDFMCFLQCMGLWWQCMAPAVVFARHCYYYHHKRWRHSEKVRPAPAETGQRRQRRERKRRQCQCSCLLCDERRVVTTHYTLHVTHYTLHNNNTVTLHSGAGSSAAQAAQARLAYRQPDCCWSWDMGTVAMTNMSSAHQHQ